MTLFKQYLVKNKCYITGQKMTPIGIMVHSTGANNPNLKRYIQPDDGKLGINKYNNHWNQYTPGGKSVCVHAFIGKLEDGTVATYQTLPWDMVGWHSGAGPKGNANYLGYIGFEICEDNLEDSEYFNKVYKEAVELCCYLCETYNIPVNKIICHSEGYKLGIASNHADVMHWFPKHGKNMDILRSDVADLINKHVEDKNINNKKEENSVDKRYNTLAEIPAFAKDTIKKMISKGFISGSGKKDEEDNPADLNLSYDMLRIFVTNDRAGLYDLKTIE